MAGRPTVLLFVLTAVAVTAPSAFAHVVPAPAGVAAGTRTTVSLDVPNERSSPLLEVTVTFGDRLTLVSAEHHGRWRAVLDGSTVRWRGGNLSPFRSEQFRVVLAARAPAGATSFAAVLDYEDGGTVRWEVPLIILPAEGAAAPASHVGVALVVGAVALSLLLGALLVRHSRG